LFNNISSSGTVLNVY